jgi:2-desacetyl-2-hydroxyethyl bacteriochlorophyllide A dehydrogenase
MKQIVLECPGRFAARDIPDPVPAAGEALVRVNRIGVCGTDLHAFAGRQPFFEYPRVLGHELGVEIVEIGANEQGLSAGDRCAVEPYLNCGTCIACRCGKSNCCRQLRVLGVHVDGGMSPLITVPVEKLHRSNRLSLEQLALVETLGIGAHAVERAAPGKDETVLVIGAGPIGLGVMQFALAAGANVIAMDVSSERLVFCRQQLGVRHTVNPQQGDAAEQIRAINNGDLPTVVMDATGNVGSMQSTFELAEHGGRIVFVGLILGDVTFSDPNFHRRELTLLASRNATSDTFRHIIAAIEAGHIDTRPWITHRLSLDEVVTHFADLPGRSGLVKAMIEV